MVYCTLTLRIIRSVYTNHFETTTNPDYVRGHNQKKDTHTLDFDVTLNCRTIIWTKELRKVTCTMNSVEKEYAFIYQSR